MSRPVGGGTFLEALARLAPEAQVPERFPRCPHVWCDRPWHGLPVRSDADAPPRRGPAAPAAADSLVLCPGSDVPVPDLGLGRRN